MKEIEEVRMMLDRLEMLKPEERQPLPHMFMMEMLGLNEQLLQLEMEPSDRATEKFRQQVRGWQERLVEEIRPLLAAEDLTPEQWEELKEFYYKQKYLLRILERLSTFASRDQAFKA